MKQGKGNKERVQELIRSLQLETHPEGGYFREVYRSGLTVRPSDGRELRPALTTIYFLLENGQISRWHRVSSDEIWHFYEGSPLELFVMDPGLDTVHRHVLGKNGKKQEPVACVPANHWQAARPIDTFSLVGCTVAPGFVFDDFRMLADQPSEILELKAKNPGLGIFL